MRIGILTRRLPPEACGVGDHTVQLAKVLESIGTDVIIFASKGRLQKNTQIIPNDYTDTGLLALANHLIKQQLDVLVLQYVPYLYLLTESGMGANPNLYPFWLHCSQNVATAIIVHEMYYQRWYDPRTWLRGEQEKQLIRQLTGSSQFVFSASNYLRQEIRQWHPQLKIEPLPISSNISYSPLSPTQRQYQRQQLGIAPEERVIVLFGAGNSLVLKWVKGLERYLNQRGVSWRWLVLGGLPVQKWQLNAPVLRPGYLEPERLSHWLQLGDLFYVPHDCGVCGKRGTIAAALQHGLPLVGTRGVLTEQFWHQVPGVHLIPVGQTQRLYATVYTTLWQESYPVPQPETQAYYHQHLSWSVIARRFLDTVKSP